jgi:hypothetical protein
VPGERRHLCNGRIDDPQPRSAFLLASTRSPRLMPISLTMASMLTPSSSVHAHRPMDVPVVG